MQLRQLTDILRVSAQIDEADVGARAGLSQPHQQPT
jgi:hypothetical protein